MANNHTFGANGYYSYQGGRTAANYIVSENFNTYSLDGVNFRKGIRDGCFVIDKEIYEGGFLNTENVGWTNFLTIN
jgi:hypothetical protein